MAGKAAPVVQEVAGTLGGPAIDVALDFIGGTFTARQDGGWRFTARRSTPKGIARGTVSVEKQILEVPDAAIINGPPRRYEVEATHKAGATGKPFAIVSVTVLRVIEAAGVVTLMRPDGTAHTAMGWVGDGPDTLAPAMAAANAVMMLEKMHAVASSEIARTATNRRKGGSVTAAAARRQQRIATRYFRLALRKLASKPYSVAQLVAATKAAVTAKIERERALLAGAEARIDEMAQRLRRSGQDRGPLFDAIARSRIERRVAERRITRLLHEVLPVLTTARARSIHRK
jgi:hypothetical protein